MFVRYCSPFLPMFLRCLMLMLSSPVELLFLLFLIAVCTCSVVMFICVGCSLRTFSVCGAGLVRNSVDELFVECTCDVFRVDVCVVFESY